jgi:hypothetical protein
MMLIRYVWKTEPVPSMGPNVEQKVKVLQFGVAQERTAPEGEVFRFVDWHDVPTVAEEDE